MNITEILKNYPKGTKLYSPVCGECKLISIDDGVYPIYVENEGGYTFYFTEDGKYTSKGECLLFPSKENRDWNTIKPKFKKGDKEYCFTPFEKVLVRDSDEKPWKINLFSHITTDTQYPYMCMINSWKQCIPYEGNQELLGTDIKPK